VEPLIFTQPHWEALTPNTQQAFQHLKAQAFIQNFYLAGGTGLALHLGHRFSVDLDFFSENPNSLGTEERAIIRRAVEDPTLTITHDKDGTFVVTWQGVGLSFFVLDSYPLVTPVATLEKIRVASVKEIGAMKLAAVIGRGTRKDFVDLYFILQQVSLEELFSVAAVKYARVRTFATSATRAMAYFEDAEALPMPKMLDPTPWSKMKRYLEKQATQVGRQHLEDLWE
jgi:predicted nucleotidyltransferase component of viral defense system